MGERGSVFFIASKIFWMLASPINLLLFGALAGALLCNSRRARFGRALALAAILILLAGATLPLRGLMIGPLENRFPQPPPDMRPPYGIIVLGGAIDDLASRARGQLVCDEGCERITDAVILAKRYPEARVVYTGGTASLAPGASSAEALRAREFMTQMGVAPERIIIEDKSRNTEENARFTAAIVIPNRRSAGASSLPPSICRARWASSRRQVFSRSPIPCRFTRSGGGLTT